MVVQRRRGAPVDKNAESHPHSWRVAILPFLDCNELYEQYRFDEPWDSEGNLAVMEKMPEAFRHPHAPQGTTNTSYVGIVGPNSAFAKSKARTFAHITDGTSNTAWLVETKAEIPWTKPEDFDFELLRITDPKKRMEALSRHFFVDHEVLVTGFMDGSVSMLSSKKLLPGLDGKTLLDSYEPPQAMLDLFQINDGRVVDRSQLEPEKKKSHLPIR